MIKSRRNSTFALFLAIILSIALPTFPKISPRGQISPAAISKKDILSHELSTYFNLNEVKTPFTAKINFGSAYTALEPYSTTPNYLGSSESSDFISMVKISSNTIVTFYDNGKLKVTTTQKNGANVDALFNLRDSSSNPICTHAAH